MLITVLKSKIHMATLTSTEFEYEGSIAVCPALIKAAGLIPGEKVQVLTYESGNRFETYVIEGKKGEISLKGPAAKLGTKGERVILLSYAQLTPEEAKSFKAKKVYVDSKNQIKN
ncbi:MAG: aspartate 1-decarboxylase [bacterium]